MTGPAPFDVLGPLPSGFTVLEASAGTGKTFTIAALAARYVAEDVPIEQLLLVTFTRSATGELRERVRERLVSAESGLRQVLAGAPPPTDDEVLALIVNAPRDELEGRQRRLAAALADFDAATIATTHGFCQHMLSGLGIGGDVEADVAFVEDLSDLVDEVVDDFYVRKFWRREPPPPFTRTEALAIGRIAVANPEAAAEPGDADPASVAALRVRLAQAVRAEVELRKRRRKLLTYDDLLTRLVETLRDPEQGAAACARLQERYRVAMVDEFQDTDAIQWDIVRRAFGAAPCTLVLIGDPKQAIYGFRGADVYAYLAASATADTSATLSVNWRSDQGLIDAYDALLGGAHLGHEGIEYRTVRAADAHKTPRLRGSAATTPLRVRVVHREDGVVDLTAKERWVTKPSGRRHIADDLAADVVRLLSSRTEVVSRHGDGSEAGAVAVRPGHLAVLVATHREAALVRDALDSVGVPAVINGAGSVFETQVARDWLALLRALEQPGSSTRVRAAALTVFVGWTAEQVATADDLAWDDVYLRLHQWSAVLRSRGVAALLETVTHSEKLTSRVLRRADGERRLTDVRHIGHLLHVEAVSEHLGITALTAWLGRRIAEARDERQHEDRSRRLESDAEAVQVLTIHASKGLEFPIVYLPYLWDDSWIDKTQPPLYHDPDADLRRTIDVGGESHLRFADHWDLHEAEERGEDLRLAYVALTRARHQAVVWWASSHGCPSSPLARLLFPPEEGEPVVSELSWTPAEDDVVERLSVIAARAPGAISVERTTGGDGRRWRAATPDKAPLDVRSFDRRLDQRWRRSSYSGFTAAAHERDTTSEPEDAGLTDEDLPEGTPGTASEAAGVGALRNVSLPLAEMPGGTRVGSIIHAVLERVDFTTPDLAGSLLSLLREELEWTHGEVGPVESVVAGLVAAIETPLGPDVDDVRLRDIERSDRLDELGFELPVVGGDAPTSELSLAAVADLLDHHARSTDVLAGYGDRLRDPVLAHQVRGYLNGSLDAVLRVTAGDGSPRFVVVDYKTNWLGDGEALSAWHYRPSSLGTAMQAAHYPLQAMIYSVALHRYLRWRLPGYEPEQHLAGVLYLFLRGMTGADVPRVGGQPCGVFSWRPPAELIVALSDLFDRGMAA